MQYRYFVYNFSTKYSETYNYIKQTVAEVPKFIFLIYFKWNLY